MRLFLRRLTICPIRGFGCGVGRGKKFGGTYFDLCPLALRLTLHEPLGCQGSRVEPVNVVIVLVINACPRVLSA